MGVASRQRFSGCGERRCAYNLRLCMQKLGSAVSVEAYVCGVMVPTECGDHLHEGINNGLA
jgi:hypothetical protein